MRTGTPRFASSCLISKGVCCVKWKILAAATAEAPDLDMAKYISLKLDAPPDAITGILTDSETTLIRSKSYPFIVPSLSIEVNKISPAPLFSTSLAHLTTSKSVGTPPE